MGKEDRARFHVLIHSPPWDMFIHSPNTFFTPGSHSSPVLGPETTELVHAALTLTEPNSSKGSRIGLQNRALGTGVAGGTSIWCSWKGFLKEQELKLSFEQCLELDGWCICYLFHCNCCVMSGSKTQWLKTRSMHFSSGACAGLAGSVDWAGTFTQLSVGGPSDGPTGVTWPFSTCFSSTSRIIWGSRAGEHRGAG